MLVNKRQGHGHHKMNIPHKISVLGSNRCQIFKDKQGVQNFTKFSKAFLFKFSWFKK